MNILAASAFAVLMALSAAGTAQAATITTLSVDFESPAFTAGAVAGQGGWGGSAAGSISGAQAHGGIQSLASGGSLTTGATHAPDAANQGEYPFSSVTFPTGFASDWWAQGWVRVTSGGVGARLAMPTWGWYIGISGTGTPTVESAVPGQPAIDLPNQGANLLDQWILVRMVHSTATDNCSAGVLGRCIDFSFLGANVDLTFSNGYTASGPYSQYLMLTGDAFWDDVSAGTGEAPSPVPLPGAAWLFGPALIRLFGLRKKTEDLKF